MKPRIIFMGTPDFATVVLKGLLCDGYHVVCAVTQPDKPQGRHMRLHSSPVKRLAQSHGIEVLTPDSVKDDAIYERLASYSPDVIVTAAYGKILPARLLDLPTHKAVNVHASLLPHYRGAAPIQWALLNGDRSTGVTIMKMDAGMDTGPILAQSQINIDADMVAPALSRQLAALGAHLLLATLPSYLPAKIKPIPQDDDCATYAPPIRREQGRIHWASDASVIHNQVRALHGWPGAYTLHRGKRLKIYRSRVVKAPLSAFSDVHDSSPGTIVEASDSLVVACQTGCLELLELQPASKRRMLASECAHNFKVGMLLGDAQDE